MIKINTRFGNANINTKFNILLIIAFIAGIILSGLTLSNVLYQRAQREISIQAELLMAAPVLAVLINLMIDEKEQMHSKNA